MLNTLRIQIKKSIQEKKYDWQVARIGDKGDISID